MRTAVERLGVLVFRFSGVPLRVARGFSIELSLACYLSQFQRQPCWTRVHVDARGSGHLVSGLRWHVRFGEQARRCGCGDAVARTAGVLQSFLQRTFSMPRGAFLDVPQ